MKQSIGRFLLNFSPFVLFFGVTAVMLFFAYGYRFDFGGRSFQKTSIIHIQGPVIEAGVYLDGKKQAEILPVQFKDLLPGSHDVIVRKEGFSPWSRSVEVKEDVVSIVRDVLLVPIDVTEYITELLAFDEDEQLLGGDGYLLALKPESNLLRAITFHDRGKFVEEEISLYESEFEILKTFADDRFFLSFPDNLYGLVGLGDREFERFSLPSSVENIQIDLVGKRVYFLHSGTLYSSLFEDLSEDPVRGFNPSAFTLVHEDVHNYVLNSDGHLYFVSMGMFYRILAGEERLRLIDRQLGGIAEIALYAGVDYDMMLLVDSEGMRRLVWIDSLGHVSEVTSHFTGQPYMDDRFRVLFTDGEGDLFLYDLLSEEKLFVRSNEEDFLLLGWLDDEGHYLFTRGGSLYVADIYGENEVLLLEKIAPTFLHKQDSALFWVEEQNLMRLYWQFS